MSFSYSIRRITKKRSLDFDSRCRNREIRSFLPSDTEIPRQMIRRTQFQSSRDPPDGSRKVAVARIDEFIESRMGNR